MEKEITIQAFEHLTNLSKLSVNQEQRLLAAKSLHHISKLLGHERTRSELLPFLSDTIESPPALPLLPVISVEDINWQTLEPSYILDPQPNVVEDLLNAKKRPVLSTIGCVPEGRIALLRAIRGASESDVVNEEIAKQLRLFIPDPLPLDDAVLVIGLLCQLSSNADVGVRTEAINSTLKILKLFDLLTLLKSGCVDLFLGMATSDSPYKQASVAYLLPAILKILLSQSDQDDDIWPLMAEIIKLFFDICGSAKASVARRAFALNFTLQSITSILLSHTRVLDRPCPINVSKYYAARSGSQILWPPDLTIWETEICTVPFIFADDPAAELRSLSVPMVLFLALVFHEKLVPRTPDEESNDATNKNQVLDAVFKGPVLDERGKRTLDPCPQCNFAWTHAACLEGVYSLASSSTFRSFVLLADKTQCIDNGSRIDDVGRYEAICAVLVAPVIRRAQIDDWLVRLTMIDALPLMFELLFPYTPRKDLEALVARGWLGLLINDDHVEVRATAIHQFPLHVWLFANSAIRDLFDPKTEEPVTDVLALPNFLARCRNILHAGASDQEVRIKLATADAVAHLSVLSTEGTPFAIYFRDIIGLLMRDTNHQVVLSTLGSLRVTSAKDNPLSGLSACLSDARKFPISLDDDNNSSLRLSSYIPIPRGRFLPLDAIRKLMSYIQEVGPGAEHHITRQFIIVALSQCLTASTGAPMRDAHPVIVPFWRIRCAALHCLPELDKIFQFSTFFQISSEATVIRGCAATALIQLGKNTSDTKFMDFVLKNLLITSRPERNPKLSKRFAISAIGKELAVEIKNGAKLEELGWSQSLYDELVGLLREYLKDRVKNVRDCAQSVLMYLFPLELNFEAAKDTDKLQPDKSLLLI